MSRRADNDTPPAPPYVRFYKALLDALLTAPLTPAQLRVCLVIVRWTIGHHNQVGGAPLSVRFIAAHASLNELTVRRALDALTAAGVVVCVEPSTGRSAAKLRIDTDPTCWMHLSPSSPKTTVKRRPAGFVVRAPEHAQDGTDSEFVRAPEHTVCVLPSTHNGDLCVLQSTDSEERTEERSEKDGDSSAVAPPPSSERKKL